MKSIVSAVSPILFLLFVGSVGMGVGCNSESPTETKEETEKNEKIELANSAIAEAEKVISDCRAEIDKAVNSKDPIKLKELFAKKGWLNIAEEKLQQAERIAKRYDLFEMEDKINRIRTESGNVKSEFEIIAMNNPF